MTKSSMNPFADCLTPEDVLARMAQSDIERVQIGIFDVDAILRWKRVSREKFEKLLTGGYSFCDVLYKWDILEQPYSSEAYGDAPARIDPASGRLSPDTAKEALFIADFLSPLGELSGRNLLAQQMDRAATQGLRVISAFEYEFFTFEETPQSIRTKRYRDLTSFQPENRTYSALAPAVNDGLFDLIEGYLNEADIWLDSMHSELGPGCFEFPLAATEGLRSADNAALFRLFVRICLQRRGLMPVFMAKWSDDWPGQSGHLHLSLRDDAGTAVFHDPDDPQGVSGALRHFVGGVTRLLPDALALCSHTVNAYRRLVPGAWAPIASTWGIQNRTAAVRVIPGGAAATRIEFRVPAADANPHLTLALLLGAGLWGLENKINPPPAIEETTYDRAFPQEQRFPRTLLEAAERLAESQVAQEIFGKAFIEHFVGTRLWEDQKVRGRVSEVELERYFEAF